MRSALVLVIGAGLAAVMALIAGEYSFTGVTPWLTAVLVPGIIGFTLVWAGRGRPAAWWVATGILAGAGLGWAVWISTGRGVDPTPSGGWIAIALGTAWPLVRAAWVAGAGRRPGRTA